MATFTLGFKLVVKKELISSIRYTCFEGLKCLNRCFPSLFSSAQHNLQDQSLCLVGQAKVRCWWRKVPWKTSGENSTTPSNELLAWQNCFRMQDSFAGKWTYLQKKCFDLISSVQQEIKYKLNNLLVLIAPIQFEHFR